MNFYRKFLIQCKKKKESPSAAAENAGLTKTAAHRWKNGSEPSDATVLKLADYFGCSVEDLMSDKEEKTAQSWDGLSDIDANILIAYHQASEADREIMDNIVSRYVDIAIKEKIIPLFGTSAAAGPGEPDTGNPWEDFAVPGNSRADFAVRITGDSMEPALHDGQIALCVKRRPEVGDIAVMMVNGAMLVKQYIKDFYGNVYLRSLNRARKDCDYNIMATGNDTVKCFGTVIAERIPLVES